MRKQSRKADKRSRKEPKPHPKLKQGRFRRILVTGGAGFIGTMLIDVLLREGYRVRVLDSLRYGGAPLAHFVANKNFEFVRGDVRERKDVSTALRGTDFVVHLAAIVGYPACRKDPALSYDINVNGTKTLARAAPTNVPILFASTCDLYGKLINELCTETSPISPKSDYGRQKARAESIVRSRGNFIIYRFATGFGVSFRTRLDVMPNDFTLRAVKDRTLIVYERHFRRNFIHVRDMARAILFAIEHYPHLAEGTFNVGSSRLHLTKEDICNAIRKHVEYYLHFADIDHDAEQRDFLVSYEKLKRLGFHPTVSIEEGIDELVRASEMIELERPHFHV